MYTNSAVRIPGLDSTDLGANRHARININRGSGVIIGGGVRVSRRNIVGCVSSKTAIENIVFITSQINIVDNVEL